MTNSNYFQKIARSNLISRSVFGLKLWTYSFGLMVGLKSSDLFFRTYYDSPWSTGIVGGTGFSIPIRFSIPDSKFFKFDFRYPIPIPRAAIPNNPGSQTKPGRFRLYFFEKDALHTFSWNLFFFQELGNHFLICFYF